MAGKSGRKRSAAGWVSANDKKSLVIVIVILGLLAAWILAGPAVTRGVNEMTRAHLGNADISEVAGGDAVRDDAVQPEVGTGSVTVMVYMNGSNLESQDGQASMDLQEMVNAGNSDNVNVIVQTMGTKRWRSTYGISSKHAQTWKVTGKGLQCVRNDLDQLDCTDPSTLAEFVSWTAQNYPADRYILLLWDHGGGPVYGYGYDEWRGQNATLTMDEMQAALKAAGVYFDFIGMDCCLMGSLEVCCALYDYCDYTILSENFESGLGWYYTNWLRKLYAIPNIPTRDLAQIICDDMAAKNRSTYGSMYEATLACLDESTMKVLYTAWTDFAYANEKQLLQANYSREAEGQGRVTPMLQRITAQDVYTIAQIANFLITGEVSYDQSYNGQGSEGNYGYNPFSWDYSDPSSGGYGTYQWFTNQTSTAEYSMSDYYVTDIMSVAQTIQSPESEALSAALAQSIVCFASSNPKSGMTGLSVSLPYGDRTFYSVQKKVFTNCGFDEAYITWLAKFTKASGADDYYDYGQWDQQWQGWDQFQNQNQFDWYEWSYYDDDTWNNEALPSTEGWSDNFDYQDSFNQWQQDSDWTYDQNQESWNSGKDDWFYQGWTADAKTGK